jgi:hypothetical protein
MERPIWNTKEVRFLVKKEIQCKVSWNQIRRVLWNRLKMFFGRPYPTDYRKPKDAEQILAANLGTMMHLLKEKRVKEKGIAIGLLGKTSPSPSIKHSEGMEL